LLGRPGGPWGSGEGRVNDPGFVVALGQQEAKLVGCCLGCLDAWKGGDGLPVAVNLVLELKGVSHDWWGRVVAGLPPPMPIL